MYKNKLVALCVVLSVVLLLESCAKEGPTGPTGPAGPAFTGAISGYVKLFDQYGSPVLTDVNYINLSITGTATVPVSTTVSQLPAGYYNFANVTTGTYSISASDTSLTTLFAATVVNNINFVSSLTLDIKLSAVPDSFITGFYSTESVATLNDSLVIHVIKNSRPRNCIVFVNTTPSVTNSTYLIYYVVPVPPNATTATLLIPQQDLIDAGVAVNQMLYFAAYSYVVNDESVYEDSYGQNVFNAVYPSFFLDSAVAP